MDLEKIEEMTTEPASSPRPTSRPLFARPWKNSARERAVGDMANIATP